MHSTKATFVFIKTQGIGEAPSTARTSWQFGGKRGFGGAASSCLDDVMVDIFLVTHGVWNAMGR